MRLNIFRVAPVEVANLQAKLRSCSLDPIKEYESHKWKCIFYYSTEPDPSPIPWIEDFKALFDSYTPQNINYYAVYLFIKGDTAYALSFGKSHFYIRPFCDYDFGVELAKRIANENDIKQTANKRFVGKKKKDIKSYAPRTQLDIESGESVEFLQGAIIDNKQKDFGKNGKFGSSALLNLDITDSDIPLFLDSLESEMKKEPRFPLPRTTMITDPDQIEHYDYMLVKELLSKHKSTSISQSTYDLYGVDFIFSTSGSFRLWCRGYPDKMVQDLTIEDLQTYIDDADISDDDILKIRIQHLPEGRPRYSETIKQSVDCIFDDERILLSSGRWMQFNQDYLDFLNEYLAGIEVEEVESEFTEISITEPDFNKSAVLLSKGYESTDKDFSILKTRSSVPIEAWDLRKGESVYAVKFGNTQKLGYVCDQAIAALELISKRANTHQVPKFKRYCLWLGYESKIAAPGSIVDSGSIILKQKIEAWARKCRELNITPVLKISHKIMKHR